MNQTVIYKGVIVQPVDRQGDRIRVRTSNPNDAQKAGLPFKDLEGGQAIFEALVPENELVAVDT
jgi:hypothetical protein